MSKPRIPSLDGLRGLAALTVFLTHWSQQVGIADDWLGIGGGTAGVSLFFALSGYLMATLYGQSRPSADELRSFALRRFGRVAPLYLLIVIACFVLTLLGVPAPFAIGKSILADHVLFIEGGGVLWSVPVEMQFYLLFAVAWLLVGFNRPAIVLALLAGAWIISATGTTSTIVYFPSFLAGIAVRFLPVPRHSLMAPLALGTLLLLILYPTILEDMGIANAGYWNSPIRLLLCAAIIWAAAGASHSPLLANRGLTFLGEISYSFYLLHWPVMWMMVNFTGPRNTGDPWIYLAATLSVSLSVAALSRWAIERPIQRLFTQAAARPTQQQPLRRPAAPGPR